MWQAMEQRPAAEWRRQNPGACSVPNHLDTNGIPVRVDDAVALAMEAGARVRLPAGTKGKVRRLREDGKAAVRFTLGKDDRDVSCKVPTWMLEHVEGSPTRKRGRGRPREEIAEDTDKAAARARAVEAWAEGAMQRATHPLAIAGTTATGGLRPGHKRWTLPQLVELSRVGTAWREQSAAAGTWTPAAACAEMQKLSHKLHRTVDNLGDKLRCV